MVSLWLVYSRMYCRCTVDDSEKQYGKSVARILTDVLPMYFAILTRIRQDTILLGPLGGQIISTVQPQVRAVFPANSLNKNIKVGLQVRLL